MLSHRLIPVFLTGLAVISSTGCDSLLHNLKPHRLWRLNRHSPPMATGSSVYYSVPDPPMETALSEFREESAEDLPVFEREQGTESSKQ